jgi:hypothetical protein
VLTHGLESRPGVFFHMMWKGQRAMMGGYADGPGLSTRFTPRAEDAPILWPDADGPLSFQRAAGWRLQIGAVEDVRVLVGRAGHGRNSFCALPLDFLPPDVPILATLIYTDTDDKERRVACELRERC